MAAQIASGAEPAMLERADALEALSTALAGVAATRLGQFALVSGEAGIGKTTLLRRFAQRAAPEARVLWGSCDALFTPRPLGPLLDIAEATRGELADLLEGEPRPHDVAMVLARELRSRQASVVVLEDAHWADHATLDVLRVLSRRLDGVSALVIVSFRDDELDAGHPLRIVLGDIAAGPRHLRLSLKPLSEEAVRTLAASHAVDTEALYRVTGGNPFFVTEVLAAGDEHVSATVRDAVLARAAPMSEPARELLEAVAIIPGETELPLLAALAGDSMERLDEALASGMLAATRTAVGFRHELARRAVEEALAPHRRLALHQRALAALAASAGDSADPARLAHHAEAAGDGGAVLRFAPAAAARAAGLGAHREAAEQYARTLRFADRVPGELRAHWLERRAHACFLIDAADEAINALETAIEWHRESGAERAEATALAALSSVLWCPGRIEDATAAARRAVEMLERDEAATAELAMACGTLAQLLKDSEDADGTLTWGTRALELFRQLDDPAGIAHALTTLGSMRLLLDDRAGREQLTEAMETATAAGLTEAAARAWVHLAWIAMRHRRGADSDAALRSGLPHCRKHGLELHGLYLLGFRARRELDRGLWDQAEATAAEVLRRTSVSRIPRGLALIVHGLIAARRGRPEGRELLDEALRIAAQSGELQRIAPAAAARAEIAWLEGDSAGVDDVTGPAIALARRRHAAWVVGELELWRRRAGLPHGQIPEAATPYAAEARGDWKAAAAFWEGEDCGYEAALARLGAGAETPLRSALESLQSLEAAVPAAIAARRLRERGVRGLPRGPRRTTRGNPAGLTTREIEVLGLVATGMRNGEIAAQLHLSRKTIDHHVSSILGKLGVRTRGQAGVEAVRLGLADRADHPDA